METLTFDWDEMDWEFKLEKFELRGWTPIKKLGSGQYGNVYLVEKDGEQRALKFWPQTLHLCLKCRDHNSKCQIIHQCNNEKVAGHEIDAMNRYSDQKFSPTVYDTWQKMFTVEWEQYMGHDDTGEICKNNCEEKYSQGVLDNKWCDEGEMYEPQTYDVLMYYAVMEILDVPENQTDMCTTEFFEKMLEPLKKIHESGYVHGDYTVYNWSSDGQVFDYGFCTPISTENSCVAHTYLYNNFIRASPKTHRYKYLQLFLKSYSIDYLKKHLQFIDMVSYWSLYAHDTKDEKDWKLFSGYIKELYPKLDLEPFKVKNQCQD